MLYTVGSGVFHCIISGSPAQNCSVVLELGFEDSLHREYGAPSSVTAEYTIDPVAKRLNVSLTWRNKTATRMQVPLRRIRALSCTLFTVWIACALPYF